MIKSLTNGLTSSGLLSWKLHDYKPAWCKPIVRIPAGNVWHMRLQAWLKEDWYLKARRCMTWDYGPPWKKPVVWMPEDALECPLTMNFQPAAISTVDDILCYKHIARPVLWCLSSFYQRNIVWWIKLWFEYSVQACLKEACSLYARGCIPWDYRPAWRKPMVQMPEEVRRIVNSSTTCYFVHNWWKSWPIVICLTEK